MHLQGKILIAVNGFYGSIHPPNKTILLMEIMQLSSQHQYVLFPILKRVLV